MSKDRVDQIVDELRAKLLSDARFKNYGNEAEGLAEAVGDSIREALRTSKQSTTDDLALAKIESMLLDESLLSGAAAYFKEEAPAKGLFYKYLYGIGREGMREQFNSSEICRKFKNNLTENLSEPIERSAIAAAAPAASAPAPAAIKTIAINSKASCKAACSSSGRNATCRSSSSSSGPSSYGD